MMCLSGAVANNGREDNVCLGTTRILFTYNSGTYLKSARPVAATLTREKTKVK